jgi:hypothetical protein
MDDNKKMPNPLKGLDITFRTEDDYFRMVADMMTPVEGTEPESSAVGVEEKNELGALPDKLCSECLDLEITISLDYYCKKCGKMVYRVDGCFSKDKHRPFDESDFMYSLFQNAHRW